MTKSCIPHLTFQTKFKIPKFVEIQAVDQSQLRFSYDDTQLKYVVKKHHKKYRVFLHGKLNYMIQYSAFIPSETVPVANSDWPFVYINCKKVHKFVCCLDTKPTNLKNIRTAPGFRGFFDTPINPVLSSVKRDQNHLCIKIVSDLTLCADFFAPIILTGRVVCITGGSPPIVVNIINRSTGDVILSGLTLVDGFFTTPPIPAGLYIIQYVCASDTSIVLAARSDFYHKSGTVSPVSVNCSICP